MPEPRVKRSTGPQGTLSKHNYRKKALKHLQCDFENRCAYCLQHLSEQHINQSHVEHFNPHLPGRRKNQYVNLMLSCSACNLSKAYKPIRDPVRKERRLLNCTFENEFPEHIVENLETCVWEAQTPAGDYHLQSIDLNEPSQIRRRRRRKLIVEQIQILENNAIHYSGSLHPTALADLQNTLKTLQADIETSVPFPTKTGLVFNAAKK